MKAISFLRVAACLAMFVPAVAGAAQTNDTEDYRREVARKYLQVMPMKDVLADITTEMAQQIPPEARQAFIDVMTKNFRPQVLETAAIESLVDNFTAHEIELFVEFYSKPEMKVAMKKFGKYMADIMPVIQAEAVRAMQEAARSGSLPAPPGSQAAPAAGPK